MSKKDDELKILRKIYSSEDYLIEDQMEQPDFKVKLKDTGLSFGVEITELFQDGSSARLKNIDGYVNEIIESKRYRHKDDINELPILELVPIINGEIQNNVKKAVEKKNPPTANIMMSRLISTIENKTLKSEKYDTSVSNIDLVIYDRESNYSDLNTIDLCKYFYSKDLEVALNRCTFREVYFITSFKDNKNIYLELKGQIFTKKMFLFNHLMSMHYSDLLKISKIEFTDLFCYLLIETGFNNVYKSSKDGISMYYSHIVFDFDYPATGVNAREINDITTYEMNKITSENKQNIEKADEIVEKYVQIEKELTLGLLPTFNTKS